MIIIYSLFMFNLRILYLWVEYNNICSSRLNHKCLTTRNDETIYPLITSITHTYSSNLTFLINISFNMIYMLYLMLSQNIFKARYITKNLTFFKLYWSINYNFKSLTFKRSNWIHNHLLLFSFLSFLLSSSSSSSLLLYC